MSADGREFERPHPAPAGAVAVTAPSAPAPAPTAPAPTPGPPRLGRRPALDGLRGVAVLLVVLVHSGDSLWPSADGWLARGGPLGVHLFFVLSGFLITTVLLTEGERTGGVRLGAFALRRARRLVPVLVALLGVLTVVAASGTRLEMRSVGSTAGHVLSFTTNSAATGHPLPAVGWLGGEPTVLSETLHTWSLAIEVQFYVLWAIALWGARRLGWTHRRLAVLTAAAVVGLAAVRAVVYAQGTSWLVLYFSTWSRLDAALVGALAGIAFVAGWVQRPPRWLVPAGVVGLAALVGCALGTDWSLAALPLGLYTVLAAGAALAILAVVSRPASGPARVLSWRPLVALGLVSYSLYIWHYPIFGTIERHDPDLPGAVRLLGGWTLAIVVAVASYVLIERPFLGRRPRRVATARRVETVDVGQPP